MATIVPGQRLPLPRGAHLGPPSAARVDRDTIRAAIDRWSRVYGVDPKLARAVAWMESASSRTSSRARARSASCSSCPRPGSGWTRCCSARRRRGSTRATSAQACATSVGSSTSSTVTATRAGRLLPGSARRARARAVRGHEAVRLGDPPALRLGLSSARRARSHGVPSASARPRSTAATELRPCSPESGRGALDVLREPGAATPARLARRRPTTLPLARGLPAAECGEAEAGEDEHVSRRSSSARELQPSPRGLARHRRAARARPRPRAAVEAAERPRAVEADPRRRFGGPAIEVERRVEGLLPDRATSPNDDSICGSSTGIADRLVRRHAPRRRAASFAVTSIAACTANRASSPTTPRVVAELSKEIAGLARTRASPRSKSSVRMTSPPWDRRSRPGARAAASRFARAATRRRTPSAGACVAQYWSRARSAISRARTAIVLRRPVERRPDVLALGEHDSCCCSHDRCRPRRSVLLARSRASSRRGDEGSARSPAARRSRSAANSWIVSSIQ